MDKVMLENTHSCLIYETDEERWSSISSFLQEGLNRNEKVFYISDTSGTGTLGAGLNQAGISHNSSLAIGKLNVLNAEETYLWGGVFQPDRMIGMLQTQSKRALAEGYSGARFTGEMTWALTGALGSERLIEYEAKLNVALEGYNVTTLCQYDRRCFSPSILLYALTTHPLIYIGSRLHENFYYQFSPGCLACEAASEILSRWLDHIVAGRPRVAPPTPCVDSPLIAT